MKLGAVAYLHVRAPASAACALEIDQRASRGSAIARVFLLLPVVGVCLVPFAWVAAEASRQPQFVAAIAERPVSALLVLLGLLLVGGLVAMPAMDIAGRVGARRSVRIADGLVSVTERGVFGATSWCEPLAEYMGLAHHIRASLSGARHEIVLVHPDPRRSVLLSFDTQVREADLQAMASQLGLPVVPARLIYGARVAAALRLPPAAVAA